MCFSPSTLGQSFIKSALYPMASHHVELPVPPPSINAPPTSVADMAASQQLPAQTPIFIIYTGQPPPTAAPAATAVKSSVAQLNGKALIQTPNGQILNEAAIVHPAAGGQGISIASPQAQVLLSSHANGILQQQPKHVLSTNGQNHTLPAVINGHQVIQAPPTFINTNGAPTVLQPRHNAIQSLISGGGGGGGGGGGAEGDSNVVHTSSPILTSATNSITGTLPPTVFDSSVLSGQLKPKNHLKQTTPICISHSMISEKKRSPPPLVQVSKEGATIMINPTDITSQASTTKLSQVSPKMTMIPYSLIVQPPPNISTSTLAQAYKCTDNMPIYRLSNQLNNIQPLQILAPVPSHNS